MIDSSSIQGSLQSVFFLPRNGISIFDTTDPFSRQFGTVGNDNPDYAAVCVAVAR